MFKKKKKSTFSPHLRCNTGDPASNFSQVLLWINIFTSFFKLTWILTIGIYHQGFYSTTHMKHRRSILHHQKLSEDIVIVIKFSTLSRQHIVVKWQRNILLEDSVLSGRTCQWSVNVMQPLLKLYVESSHLNQDRILQDTFFYVTGYFVVAVGIVN